MLKKMLVFLALLLVAGSLAGAIYKWVDKKGATHYSELPPTLKVPSVSLWHDAPLGAGSPTSPSPPTPPTFSAHEASPSLFAQAADGSWQAQERDFQKRHAEQEKSEQEGGQTAQDRTLLNKHRCILARLSLDALESQRPVYSVNEKGERAYVDDTKRASELDLAKKDVSDFCPPQAAAPAVR